MGLHIPAHKFIDKRTFEDDKLKVEVKSRAIEKKKLSVKEIQEILDNENVWEFEPWQVLSLPINSLK